MTSSTNRKCVRFRLGDTLIPKITPLPCPLVISKLKLSIISIKRRGDRGQPYLIPIDTGKNLEGVPLMRTTKLEDSTQPIIQFIKVPGIPI